MLKRREKSCQLYCWCNFRTQRKWSIQSICPDCTWNANETFLEGVLQYFNGEIISPVNGVCQSGVKWIHHGPYFDLDADACCCLQLNPSQSLDCTTSDAVQCPPVTLIGITEVVKDYALRISKVLKDAPSNGCCPAGTFKYIFTGDSINLSHDVCTCIRKYKIGDGDMIL